MITNTDVMQFLSGVLVMGYIVAGLFFTKFWRESRDRLFAGFAGAFFILAVRRVLVALLPSPSAGVYGSPRRFRRHA